ncbi:epoxyqueuosine reductase QueH [Candidatus Saganbacteria bacterium]|nr:epoxyqueuosine reductase QueH [Candidatus Saganbacteria bacterium]
MKKVLLHACCAPCATQVLSELNEEHFDLTGFFYNPNIFPAEEYGKRKSSMEEYCRIVNLPMVYIENDLEHRSGDCPFCYETRLLRTAQYAKGNGFEAFTTTLLISPYQNHELIKKIGFQIEEEFGIIFAYRDFRPGHHAGRAKSREYNLYRQKYCGCASSLKTQEVKK